MTSHELLNILNKQWATAGDIKQIGSVGINKSHQIRKEIANNLEKQGYHLPTNLVPMEKVVDYFKINVNYLKRLAKLEKEG